MIPRTSAICQGANQRPARLSSFRLVSDNAALWQTNIVKVHWHS